MSSYAYQEILEKVLQLPSEEKLKLIEAILADLRVKEDSIKLHSIMEFEGLGKEIWEGIDAQDYVNEERNSWDTNPPTKE